VLDSLDFQTIIARLRDSGIPYAITGSIASFVKKLEYYREGGSAKHLSDIASILEYSGDEIDHPSLASFIQKAGVETEWEQALAAGSTFEER
jgi:hypothetical protein